METCGSLAMPENRHAVCGEFYVQCYHPSTDKHEKAHWHLSLRCFSRLFCDWLKRGAGCKVSCCRGGEGKAYKGRVQQTSVRISFVPTILSHTASSVDF